MCVEIETALVRLGCVLRSSLIKEKIGKLTRFLTGRRFVFVNIPERPLERTVKIGGSPRACITRNSRGPTHSRQHAPGAWREAIASLRVQTTSDAESAVRRVPSCLRREGRKRGDPVCDAVSVRRVTSVVIQSVMLSPSGGSHAW